MPNESLRSALPKLTNKSDSCFRSELNRAGRKIFLYHQSDLEDDRVIKFAEIQTGQLLDLLKTVDQRVAVNEQLSGGLGYIQVVLEETQRWYRYRH